MNTMNTWETHLGDIAFAVDPQGVDERLRLVGAVDQPFLHGYGTSTIGINFDVRPNWTDVIQDAGGLIALLRAMRNAGAHARDIAHASDYLRYHDEPVRHFAVAQSLDAIETGCYEYGRSFVTFSNDSRDVRIFGDGYDEDRIDACIIAPKSWVGPVRVFYPDGSVENVPIASHALETLVKSLRADKNEALYRIAVSSPACESAIPDFLRASIEIRVYQAMDVSRVKNVASPYQAMSPDDYPVSVSGDATIAVVSFSGETIVEVPIQSDVLIPRFCGKEPLECREVLNRLSKPARTSFVLILNASDVRKRLKAPHTTIVRDLADVFLANLPKIVVQNMRYTPDSVVRWLTSQAMYLHFPLAIPTVDVWTIPPDVSLAHIEHAMSAIVSGSGIRLIRNGRHQWILDCSPLMRLVVVIEEEEEE